MMDCTTLGTAVSGSVHDCLAQAGLDYTVLSAPACFSAEDEERYRDVPRHYVTYRADTGQPFGVVKSKYEIIQNEAVYSFLDMVSGLEITNAGLLRSGGWLCGKFANEEVLGDVFAPYVFFSNSHDGSSKFIVAFTPVRIACGSVVNITPSNSTFHFGVRHTQIASHKLRIAQGFVRQSAEAVRELRRLAEMTVAKTFTASEVNDIFERVLISPTGKPGKTYYTDLQLLHDAYFEADVLRYQGTGYGIILAVSRFVTNILPTRTRNNESVFHNLLFRTHPLLSAAYKLVMA